jgi:hypothetical protein
MLLQVVGRHLNLLDARLLDLLHQRRRDFLALPDDGLAALRADRV